MPRELHVDTLLTDQAIAYIRRKPSVMRRVLPVVPVTRESDLYTIFNREDFNRSLFRDVGLGDRAPEWIPGAANDRYLVRPQHLSAPIFWRRRREANDPAQYESAIVQGLIGQARLAEDLLFAREVMVAGAWASSNQLTGVASGTPGATQFLSLRATGSSPIGLVERMKDIIRQQTMSIADRFRVVVSSDVHVVLKTHPELLTRTLASVQGGGVMQGSVKLEQMALLLDVDAYDVIDAAYITSAPGATAAIADVAAGVFLVLGDVSVGTDADMTPAAAKLFDLSGEDIVKSGEGTGAVRRWTEDARKLDMVEACVASTCEITSQWMGAIATGAIVT
jgi:hypothetical protein